MNNSKAIALGLVTLSGFGLWLQSQGKLRSVLSIIVSPSSESIGRIAAAFIVLLAVIAVLPSNDAAWLVVLLLLGAIYANPHILTGGVK